MPIPVNLDGLPTEMLYELADRYKAYALSCSCPQFLTKAKVIEIVAGLRSIEESTVNVA